MKVLCFTPWYKPAWVYGGPPFCISQICEKMKQKGVDITVYTTNAFGKADLDVSTDRIVEVSGVPVRYFKRIQTPWGIDSLDLRTQINRDIREFDLVHVSSVWLALTSAVCEAAVKNARPYVFSLHGALNPAFWRARRIKHRIFWGLLQRHYLKKAAVIHCVSQKEKDDLAGFGKALADTRVVIPNPINTSDFVKDPALADRFRRHLNIASDKKLILFLGRVSPTKGLDLFLKSCGPVLKESPNWLFCIIGPDESGYKKHLEMMVKSLGLTDKVLFNDYISGDLKIGSYSASELFVLTSYFDACSMSVLEAMAMGVPVIISAEVGNAREVGMDNAGRVVPLSINAVRQALRELMKDPLLRKEYSAAGLRCVKSRYDIDGIYQGMLKVYEDCLAK